MKILDHLEEWLITFLMGAATLLIFVAVMFRQAGKQSVGNRGQSVTCAVISKFGEVT